MSDIAARLIRGMVERRAANG